MKRILFIIPAILIIISCFAQEDSLQWKTHYELSAFLETPRYDETIRYCKQIAENSMIVEYRTFGISPQLRELPLLIIDKDSDFDNIKGDKAVVMIQACIHPGESEGKDAGMMLLRDIVIQNKYPGILDNVQIMFIPIFNVDGHERWSKYSRINQNGPKEMGWRVNANNLNLNRDYMKADTREMQDWLTLACRGLPDFFIDCHTTDGADFQYVLTYAMETGDNMDSGLAKWQTDGFIPEMEKNMFAKDFPVFPYVQFRNWHDPRSGLKLGAATPMISQGYTALQNRPGLLIETHMLKPYKPRVESTYELLRFSLDYVNNHHSELKELIANADKETAALAGNGKLGVKYKVSMDDSIMVDFLGVQYTVEESDLTGGNWFKYSSVPATFSIPFFRQSIATEEVELPMAYIIPLEWDEVITRLAYHCIDMYPLYNEDSVLVEYYSLSDVKFRQQSYEGRHKVDFNYELKQQYKSFPNGAIVIPVNVRNAKVIAYLLEPMADNSLASWGFFNTIFEQKEYGESYVMEPLAREMLKNDKDLRVEFEKKKAEDSNFAKSQWMMLNWFYSKTKWWDDRINIYPVYRVNDMQFLKANGGVPID